MEDLSQKTVYDLDQEEFNALFCRRCKQDKTCSKRLDTVKACQALVDSAVWYKTNERGN